MPNMRPKLVVNEPTLRSPTVKQTSATERSVFRSRAAARSSRRICKYWCGDSPNSRRNSRLKCAGESFAARASAFTSSCSRYRASTRSFARRRWRAGCGATTHPSIAEAARPEASARGDVVVEELDLERLQLRLELDEVADRDEPDDLLLVDDGDVPDPAVGHHRHTLVDSRFERSDDERRGHDLPHRRVLGSPF